MSKKDISLTIFGIVLLISAPVLFFYFQQKNLLWSMLSIFFGFFGGFFSIMATQNAKKFHHFFESVKAEFVYILWPNQDSVFKSFVAVVLFCLFFAGLIWILDAQLSIIYKQMLVP